ncbi:LysM peptidoglycan-binding domain-containing protein [Halomonas aquamarina]|uniref:LysM peptidoglycan-binding domain-containing protein n=1 Tax=Vreelandella aquamarina TaxID=77097 RepID=A0ACC5VW41_9GAMM|nr:FimV/HubP family polar landmark protein [Halomonas aquamarina]MBZ5488282.1 LysM peptidoglycan-binding domain-containing protein [Halomonas aquamarina]
MSGAFALAAASFSAHGLEPGSASVTSAMQAPLSATITLNDASAYPLDEIHVSLADQGAFERQGLEWIPATDSVRVELKEAQGRRYIAIHSAQPVTSSWMDLLLDIEYPEGHLMHPVTLLLDPPGYGQGNSPRHEVPEHHGALQGNAEEPEAASGMTLVQAGDTLWSIAERTRPAEASVQQMMLALVQANPVVFPSGDINRLQAGQVLNVPGIEQAQARSRAQAADAVQVMVRTGHYPDVPTAAPPPVQPDEGGANRATDASDENAPSTASGLSDAPEPPGAIAELAARLEESQARLQYAEAEREQLRLSLEELHESIDSLRQRIDESQPALPGAAATASAGLADTRLHTQHAAPGHELLTGLERYQWPLISLALGLLLLGLLWLRKRREGDDEWQNATSPGVKPFDAGEATRHKAMQPPLTNIPLSCADGTKMEPASNSSQRQTQDDQAIGDTRLSMAPPFSPMVQAAGQSDDYSKSQAAGLAGPRYRELKPVEEQTAPVVLTSSLASGHPLASPGWEIEEVAFAPQGRDNS